MPERVQLRRVKGWRMPENTVKVDRSTKWGNPFVEGRHGSLTECIQFYRQWLEGYTPTEVAFDRLRRYGVNRAPLCWCRGVRQPCRCYVMQHLDLIRGKNLACWCPLDAPCHADVLLEIANR